MAITPYPLRNQMPAHRALADDKTVISPSRPEVYSDIFRPGERCSATNDTNQHEFPGLNSYIRGLISVSQAGARLRTRAHVFSHLPDYPERIFTPIEEKRKWGDEEKRPVPGFLQKDTLKNDVILKGSLRCSVPGIIKPPLNARARGSMNRPHSTLTLYKPHLSLCVLKFPNAG